MKNLSDVELMKLVIRKCPVALEELYDRYGKLIYSFAVKSLRNEHAAREIVQLVFTRLWITKKEYNPHKGLFENWLFMITRNITIDYLRKERKHSAAVNIGSDRWEQIADDLQNDPGEKVPAMMMRQNIRHAFRYLSVSQVQLIEQLYWQGYRLSEIARMNNEPLGTIKSRLHQSLKILRKYLLVEKEG